MNGWLFGKNIGSFPKTEGQISKRKQYYLFRNLLNKFPDDIVDAQGNDFDCFFDGYLLDKEVICQKYGEESWEKTFKKNCNHHIVETDYRGGFCGFVVFHDRDETVCFTDHLGNRAIYYYYENNKLMIASRMDDILDVLSSEKIKYELDSSAVKYLLTFGAMIDDTTFIKSIKRVMPGHKVSFKDGMVKQTAYYRMDNRKVRSDISENEAVELIDQAFRTAIKREFDKDKEYGYKHLVNLSGGLDSRMVCWVAHSMGYTEQLNTTYCRKGYLDQKIAEQIAMDLKHQYLFMPLDDCSWVYDIDEIIRKNNGAALYSGIGGGNRMLSMLDTSRFGIEHTGMVGDVIPSSFYKDREIAYGEPRFDLHVYSNKIHYEYDTHILEQFPNQEIFALYTRGILCAASSYIIRQCYVETSSPFLDVDFLNVCLSLPFEYRKKHHIYLKWIEQKYPEAANYGWEKWGGVKPRESHIKYRRFVTMKRLLRRKADKLLKRYNQDNMNPLDYWYAKDPEIQTFYQDYYHQFIEAIPISEEIRKDMKKLFCEGTVGEKSMVLTVLAIYKNYFEESKELL